MKEYNFHLTFKVSSDLDQDQIVEALGDAGCTDALVGLGHPGLVTLEFTREHNDALEAMLSGIDDVKRALPNARVVEAGPDIVGITEVADIAGFSRQNMRKLFISHCADFPAPVHSGSSLLWHLASVLEWFAKRHTYEPAAELVETARAAMTVNAAKEESMAPLQITDEVLSRVNE